MRFFRFARLCFLRVLCSQPTDALPPSFYALRSFLVEHSHTLSLPSIAARRPQRATNSEEMAATMATARAHAGTDACGWDKVAYRQRILRERDLFCCTLFRVVFFDHHDDPTRCPLCRRLQRQIPRLLLPLLLHLLLLHLDRSPSSSPSPLSARASRRAVREDSVAFPVVSLSSFSYKREHHDRLVLFFFAPSTIP